MVFDPEGSSPKQTFEPIQSGDVGQYGFSIIKPGRSVVVTYPDGKQNMVSWNTAVQMQKGMRQAAEELSKRW